MGQVQLVQHPKEFRLALEPLQGGEVRQRQPDPAAQVVAEPGQQERLIVDREQDVVPLGGEPIGQELEVADRVDVPAGTAMPGPDEPAEPSQAERVRVADLDAGAGRPQGRNRLPG